MTFKTCQVCGETYLASQYVAPGQLPKTIGHECPGATANGTSKLAAVLWGFAGWLTSRDEELGPLSSRHDARGAAEAVAAFCEANGFEEPSTEEIRAFCVPLEASAEKSPSEGP